MAIDFTLSAYRHLLNALQQVGYAFYTFEEWCEEKAVGRYVILRHDVDLKAERSLMTARIEAEMGIRASYYFRVVPQSNKPEIIQAIADLGHEIGYHYEDLSLFNGNADKALEHFKAQLAYFHQFYPVKTICMHGSPTSKFDNRDLWKLNDYRELGVIGEPYLDFLSTPTVLNGDIVYFTDTARMWDGEKYNVRDKSVISNQLSASGSRKKKIHSTFDFIEYIKNKPVENVMMITTHPQRWIDKPLPWLQELVFQSMKNLIKKMLVARQ
jgi:hypothetical protein